MKIHAGVPPQSHIPDYFHQYSYKVNATIKALESLKNEPYMPRIVSHTVEKSIDNKAVYDMDAKDKVIVNTKNLGYNVYDILLSGLENARPITNYDVTKMLDILIKLSEKRYVHGAALPEAFLTRPDGSYMLQNVGLLTRRTTQNRFADVFTLYYGFRDQQDKGDAILQYLQGVDEFNTFSKDQIRTIIMNSNPVRFYRFLAENDPAQFTTGSMVLPFIGIGVLSTVLVGGAAVGTKLYLDDKKKKEEEEKKKQAELDAKNPVLNKNKSMTNIADNASEFDSDEEEKVVIKRSASMERFSMRDQLQKMVQEAVEKALQKEGITSPPLPRAPGMLDISASDQAIIPSPSGEVDLSREVTPIHSPRTSRLADTSKVGDQTLFNMNGMEYDEFKRLGRKYGVSVPEMSADFTDEVGQSYFRVPKDTYAEYVKLLAKHHTAE